MEDNGETNIVEVFDKRPSKKSKCSESSGLDDPLPSPTVSSSSMVSECSESIGFESDNQIKNDTSPSPPSPTMPMLSPSSVMKEEVVSEGEKPTFSEGDEQTNQSKHTINYITYDYLPQGKIFTSYFKCISL